MPRTAASLALAALLAATAAADTAPPSQPPAAVEGALTALHRRWFDAFDKGDGPAMDRLETDDLVLVLPTGVIWTKAEPRAAGTWPVHNVTRTLARVRVRAWGDSAVLTGVLTTRTGEDTQTEAETVVCVQHDGRWRVASAQWTPVPPAPPGGRAR